MRISDWSSDVCSSDLYPPARLLFGSHGATVAGIPVDDQGMRVDLIPDGTSLIYVTPSHQFPLGMPMSQARREALLARAYELRSEERRGGQGCVNTCRYRWSPTH